MASPKSSYLSKTAQRKICVANLQRLGIYPPFAYAFEHGLITQFFGSGGFFIEDKELLSIIHLIEEHQKGTVYAVINTSPKDDHILYLLFLPNVVFDATNDIIRLSDDVCEVTAVVWNKTKMAFVNMERINVKSIGGGLVKVDVL